MNTTQQIIADSIHTWDIAYIIWAAIFYTLCVLMLLLPGLIAANFFETMTNRILAALTVAVSLVLNWANLGVVAGNFDQARENLRLAVMQYDTDKDNNKLQSAYKAAADLVRWSPGIPQTSTTTKEQKQTSTTTKEQK